MTLSRPNKVQIDELVSAGKVVPVRVYWQPVECEAWRLSADVHVPILREVLSLRGYIGPRNFGFTLLYQHFQIRGYNKHAPHRVRGRVFDRPHKHVGDEEWDEYDAYYPDDIDADDNLNDQFLAFCRECNIQLAGGYQALAYEMG